MSRPGSLFLRRFDQLGLAIALAALLFVSLGPSRLAKDVRAVAHEVDERLPAVEAYFARGAATAPPTPPRELEGRAASWTRSPPEPERLPAWCLERRPAFLHQVERDPQPASAHEPPVDLVADASEPGRVRLAWRAGPGSARVKVAFTLERKVGDGPWTRIAGPGEATTHDDTPPLRRPLRYRVISTAALAPVEGEPEPLPLEPGRAELAVELAQPVEALRPFALLLKDGWVAPELGDAPGWATLVVVQLGPGGSEQARKTLLRVEVGQPIGDSGAVLLSVEARRRPAKFAQVLVEVPAARIRWPDGVEEELTPE